MAELSSSEEDILFVGSLLCDVEEEEEITKRKRSFWVHPINQKRCHLGEFYHLYPDLEKKQKKYFQYFRMSQRKFSELVFTSILCTSMILVVSFVFMSHWFILCLYLHSMCILDLLLFLCFY